MHYPPGRVYPWQTAQRGVDLGTRCAMRPEQPGGSAVEAKRATTLLAVITFAGGVWCVCGLLEGGDGKYW